MKQTLKDKMLDMMSILGAGLITGAVAALAALFLAPRLLPVGWLRESPRPIICFSLGVGALAALGTVIHNMLKKRPPLM